MLALGPEGDFIGVPLTWWAVFALIVLALVFGGLNALLNRRYVFEDGLVSGVVGRMGSGKSLFIVQRVLLPFCRALSRGKGVVWSSTQRPVRRVVTNFRFDPGLPHVDVVNVSPTHEDSIFRQVIELAERLGSIEGPWYDESGILQDGRKSPPDLPPVELASGKVAYVRQPILNALVVLDEMHLFAPSSKVAMDHDASYVISMARKYNSEIWWASQHEMKVNKRLRDESSVLWLAGKFTGFASFFIGSGWHMARCYVSSAQVERARNAVGGDSKQRARDRRIYRYSKRAGKLYNSFELIVPDPVRRPTRARQPGPVQPAPGSPVLELVDSGSGSIPETELLSEQDQTA